MEVAAGVGGGASAGAAVLLAVLAILGVFGETNTRKKPRLDASVLAPRGQTDWDRIDRKGDDRAFVCILQLDRSAFDRLHAARGFRPYLQLHGQARQVYSAEQEAAEVQAAEFSRSSRCRAHVVDLLRWG